MLGDSFDEFFTQLCELSTSFPDLFNNPEAYREKIQNLKPNQPIIDKKSVLIDITQTIRKHIGWNSQAVIY